MSPLEFALSVTIILVIFLGFAMTLSVVLVGNEKTQEHAVKLFEKFLNFLSRCHHR